MSLRFDKNAFTAAFPNATTHDKYIQYTVEDSDYKVHYPKWSSDGLTASMQIEHVRAGATDDDVELTVVYDGSTANIASVDGKWNAGNDGYTIPSIVIRVVDDVVEMVGAAGAVETLGVSEEVAADVIVAFDAFAWLFNKLSPIVVKLSDNGGRFYTTAVVCHAVNRLTANVSVG